MQKIEPTNKAAKAQIIASRNKLKSQREREKKRFANMFDKFAAEDTRFVFHPAVAWPPRGTGVQGLCFTQPCSLAPQGYKVRVSPSLVVWPPRGTKFVFHPAL